jgi:undecaprenyl-diphosphatase
MIEYLLELDKQLFLSLNSYHTEWLDAIMLYVTSKLVWIPFYIIIAYFIFKQEGLTRGIVVLICIALTILLADQITSAFMKPYFARFRPSHEPALKDLVHIVNGDRGGKFGFASSHAANTFGLALFIFLMFKDRTKQVAWIFLWAAIVSYSRIYLGVHYPGDIIAGGLVGMACAWGCYILYTKITGRLDQPTT